MGGLAAVIFKKSIEFSRHTDRGSTTSLMKLDLNKSERHYLRFLVKQDLKKRERGAAKLQPKPGQDMAEFEEIRTRIEGKIPFIQSVLHKIAHQEDDVDE
jgi:hypothetical protein